MRLKSRYESKARKNYKKQLIENGINEIFVEKNDAVCCREYEILECYYDVIKENYKKYGYEEIEIPDKTWTFLLFFKIRRKKIPIYLRKGKKIRKVEIFQLSPY